MDLSILREGSIIARAGDLYKKYEGKWYLLVTQWPANDVFLNILDNELIYEPPFSVGDVVNGNDYALLPPRTIVVDDQGDCLQKHDSGKWAEPGRIYVYDSTEINRERTIAWLP